MKPMAGLVKAALIIAAGPGSDAAETPAGAMLLEAADYAYVREGFRTALVLSPDAQLESRLRGVLREALSHPGGMARAQLAFSVMTAQGAAREPARALGCAIEYFHTASLIFDDLPCMDDARERRGQPCAHRTQGEGAAILGALALINEGYRLMWSVFSALPDAARRAAADLAGQCLGVNGILNGQAHDLHFAEGRRDETAVMRVARGKTVTLTRLTLVLPGLVCGAEARRLEQLETVAEAWGLSYQIMDDFKDFLMQPHETGKSAARDQALERPNLPMAIGCAAALERLTAWLSRSRAAIRTLTDETPGLRALERLQSKLEAEQAELAGRLRSAPAQALPILVPA